jgi:tight adherence protein B
LIRFAAIAALVAAMAATPAAAAVELSRVDASRHPTVQLSVVTDRPAEAVPVLRENGHPVAGLQAQNLGRAKSVALLIDNSRSMAGRPLVDAIAAARSFVGGKEDADRLAVVTFGQSAVQTTRFSSATIDTDGALRNLALDPRPGTALYDAIHLASLALATEVNPGRVIVLVTDGNNVAKGVSLEKALAAAKHAGVAVYAIGIESRDFAKGPLEQIAAATGGAYYGASSSGALAQAYDALARDLARTWRVSYLTAARPGQQLSLAAAVAGSGSATTQITLPGSTPAPPGDGFAGLLPEQLFTSGVASLVLSLAVGGAILVAAGMALATPASTRLRRRLSPHVGGPRRRAKRASVRERFEGASGLLKATERAFARFSFWPKLHAMLERADVPLRTAEFFYCMVVPAFFFALIAGAMGFSALVILIATATGALIPLLVLWWKAKRRVNAIDEQLPDLLITMAASLKAGHSFRQAMQAVVNEGQPPISDEFKRVLTEAQLGRPIDDALSEMADRVQSKNLSFVMTAVTIQRQVGGSLAGIFDMVADAVRQRQAFARKIKGLTAMGRASAYTLVGMPFALALIITAINAEYMSPLYHTSTGHKIIGVGLVMMAMGSYMLRKIASFRG